jgi:hypothetical protein
MLKFEKLTTGILEGLILFDVEGFWSLIFDGKF